MINIKRNILLIITAVLVTAAGYCQQEAETQDMMTIDGKVVSIDTSNSLIVVNAEIDYTFSVNLETKFTRDIYDIGFSDIGPGDYVDVEYYNDASGRHIATHISVEYELESEYE